MTALDGPGTTPKHKTVYSITVMMMKPELIKKLDRFFNIPLRSLGQSSLCQQEMMYSRMLTPFLQKLAGQLLPPRSLENAEETQFRDSGGPGERPRRKPMPWVLGHHDMGWGQSPI
jgi:hypothetical protein